MSLHPCTSCSRHVRSTDNRCPFCTATNVAPVAPAAMSGPPNRRILTRAALLFAGAAAAAASTACGPPPVVAMYGPAPINDTSDAGLNPPLTTAPKGPVGADGGAMPNK